MESDSLEALSDHFRTKLHRLTEGLALLSCQTSSDEDIQEESTAAMESLWQEVDELSDIITLTRSKLADQRKSLLGVTAVKKNLQSLIKGLQYTTTNLPPHLPALSVPLSAQTQGSQPSEAVKTASSPAPPKLSVSAGSVSSNVIDADHTATKASCTTSKPQAPPPPCPLMDYLTVDEFNDIPKYMKGRISYQQVNNVVDELNKAFIAKYKLLKLKKSTMNDIQRKRCETLRMQANKDTKGIYFLVEGDIKEWSGLKMSRETHGLFTILRHCGRMYEIRGDGYVRYALIEMY